MNGSVHTLKTLVHVILSEGLRAARDRIADQRAERRRLRSLTTVAGTSGSTLGEAGVLNLSPIPPYPRRGGSQIQMLHRLHEEARLRTVALLYPGHSAWHLERSRDGRGELEEIPCERPTAACSCEEIADAVAEGARAAGSSLVHIENLFGLPLELVPALRARGLGVIHTVHDFACFCRRPHLIRLPDGRFCEYCTDAEVCARCLEVDRPGESGDQVAHRRAGAVALADATAVVFPSTFHRDRHRDLFPEAMANDRTVVINPATRTSGSGPAPPARHPHLAVVGGVKLHKGGALVADLLHRLRETMPDLRVTVFGDGDAVLLNPLRKQRSVSIRGYYRAGELPGLLRRAGATVAVLPSIWPESYGLVVDECLSAGVPVAAFDLGAVGMRLRKLEVGALAEPDSGTGALAEAVVAAAAGGRVPPEVIAQLPTPAGVARQLCELYESLI